MITTAIGALEMDRRVVAIISKIAIDGDADPFIAKAACRQFAVRRRDPNRGAEPGGVVVHRVFTAGRRLIGDCLLFGRNLQK